MLIGYARVSTVDQNLALQRDALAAAGCARIFTDEGISGSVIARRGLDAAVAALGSGDTLIVWKLDRLGRSLSHLVALIAELGSRGVNFRGLSDPTDIFKPAECENYFRACGYDPNGEVNST
jgi:DNA invertase Pin-like site-specific DNA recombinase